MPTRLDAAEDMNQSITKQGRDHNETTENHDAGPCIDLQQLANRLSGQHRATGGKAYIHDTHCHDRYDRAVYAKLDTGQIIWGKPSCGP